MRDVIKCSRVILCLGRLMFYRQLPYFELIVKALNSLKISVIGTENREVAAKRAHANYISFKHR